MTEQVQGQSIQARFAEVANAFAEKAAVCYQENVITYGDLHKKSNELARLVQKKYEAELGKPIAADVRIGLIVDRGIWMVMGLLGILKSGAAFLPLDPCFPSERLGYIVDNAELDFVVCCDHLQEEFADMAAKAKRNPVPLFYNVDDLGFAEAIPADNAPEDVAYCMYTSGTTGMPKGVQIRHQSFINVMDAQRDNLCVNHNSVVLQFASLTFDVALSEIFSALFNGASLVIASTQDRKSMSRLLALIEAEQVTILGLTPSLLALLPKVSLPSVKTIRVGGDVIDQSSFEYWSKQKRFINSYGPTETTVTAFQNVYKPGDQYLKIGAPLKGVCCLVLDTDMQSVMEGDVGELYIGGPQVAKGYINAPDENFKKFMRINGERYYKTGDLVKQLPNGALEFVRRYDDQIKYNGYRIEPSEIEQHINTVPGVVKSVVTTVHRNGVDVLVAAVTSEYSMNSNDLKKMANASEALLQHKLPKYMCPSRFVMLDNFPLNFSGKVDRPKVKGELQELIFGDAAQPAAAGLERFKNIWRRVTGLSQLSPDQPLVRYGVSSLTLMALVAELKDAFEAKNLENISANMTVKDLVHMCELDEELQAVEG